MYSPDRSEGQQHPLAAENARVRRLALAVAGEQHQADDLAQDAWLVLLRKSPLQQERLSTWLGGTMRNILRLKGRTDARRSEREQAVAKPEQEDCSQQALEHLDLHQAILQAVRELKEPYRTTVLLRWFEELEPSEIAKRTGVPVRTVHTRVSRALAMLRKKLGPRWGTSGPVSAFVAWMSGMHAPTWKGILAMQTKTKVALAATVLGCMAVVVPVVLSRTAIEPQEDDDTSSPPVAALPEADEQPGSQSEHAPFAPTREAMIDAPDEASSKGDREAAFLIVGKTVDRMSNPVPFVPLVVESDGADGKNVVSDGLGEFSLRLDNLASGERVEMTFSGGSSDVVVMPLEIPIVCSGTATIDLMVLCSRESVVVRGRLLFASGDPVSGGFVRAHLGPECHADDQGIFELSTASWRDSINLSFGTNKSGLFSLGSARLSPTKEQIEAGLIEGLELRIPVADCDGIALVTDEDGHALEAAEVLLDGARPGQRAFSNVDGVATIWFEEGIKRGVWVRKKGYAPQFAGIHRLDCGGTLNVKLAQERTCRGRVIDSLGAGISGATVEVGPDDFREPSDGQWTIAGPDGSFSFKVAANDARHSLVAKTKDGRVGKASFHWARSNGGEVLIQADQRCVIAGLVVDQDENPVPDASVSSRREDVVDETLPAGVTDHLGAFRLPVEETGTYIVHASKGYAQGGGSAKCGEQLVIRLDLPCYVSGRVRSKTGGAVEQFRVRVLAEKSAGGGLQAITPWSTFVKSETFAVDVDQLKEGDHCTVEVGSVALGSETLKVPAQASRRMSFELEINL